MMLGISSSGDRAEEPANGIAVNLLITAIAPDASNKAPIPTVIVGSMVLATASRQELTNMACDWLAARTHPIRAGLVLDLNGHGLSQRQTGGRRREALDQSEIPQSDSESPAVPAANSVDPT